MLSALLRLIGVNGVDPVSATNPMPTSLVGGAGALAADHAIEAGGTTAATAVTLTIPAVAGKTIVITSLTAELFSTAARAAAATIRTVQVTNLSSAFNTKLLPNSATAIGTLEVLPIITSAVEALAASAAVVVTLPVVTGCVGRLQATYTYV